MSRSRSIETMQLGLSNALTSRDWPRVRRYIERLKGIVIDSVAQNDPISIRMAGNALQQAGQRLELAADLPMRIDETAFAWQLRADAGTAALAARVRPGQFDTESLGMLPGDVPGILFDELRKSNAPVSNKTLIHRTGKDPAVITRALKRLEKQGKIHSWRAINGQRLNVVAGTQSESTDRMNATRFDEISTSATDSLKRESAQPASLPITKTVFVNSANGKSASKNEMSTGISQ